MGFLSFSKLLFVLWILGFIFILLLFFTKNYLTKTIDNKTGNKASEIKESAPFEELTIPYLRKKSYSSKLAPLEKISENSNYTSYLTNYSSDGFKINGLLTVPAGDKPKDGFSAIVFVHGYIPPTEYKTLEKYSDYIDYLSKNGFVVFKIDLRGNGNSEGQASGAYFSSGYVIDTLNAYSALQNSSLINPDKIGLWGHSMAGNVILRAMAVNTAIPATVIWAGAVYTYIDQREYGINDLSYRPPQITGSSRNIRQSIFDKVGTPSAKGNNTFWKNVAPTSFLNDLRGAIQINHAKDDAVVDIAYSQNLNMLLDKTDVPHEFNVYQAGGHNISGTNFNLAMKNTVSFFNKYLKNDYLVK